MKEKKIKLLRAAIHCVESDIDFDMQCYSDNFEMRSAYSYIRTHDVTTYIDWKCFDEKIATIMEMK